MEYKNTLLMPKTDFEMRGNLTQKEPRFQARWAELKLYETMKEKHADKKPYVLHDGPPYANGNIHIGHALNKILKDMVVRSHHMLGHQSLFIPGWDTHGLPIETAISKLGHNRKTMTTAEFRALCDDYAKQQIQTQMADMKALGTIGDYDHYYATLQKEFEANQIEVFAKMALDGLIYKGLKPVYWSPSSESALAEAEIEYHDKKDTTLYVPFEVVEGKGLVEKGDQFVIWTTTPWTLPANLAICLNPALTYVKVKTEKGNLIFAKALMSVLLAKFKLETTEVLSEFKGSECEYIKTKHPFYDRTSLVILGDHVTDEDGTGCVHTAPGHGVEDFNVGRLYHLDAFCPVDDKGCMTAEAGDFLVGQFVEDANKTIITKLSEVNALLAIESIVHPYPHDWRTKKPVIYRATDQWFASIEKIRSKLLHEINQVKWLPEWGQLRMHNMIKDRGDWCISRQRAWGVPIPIFYTEANTAIMDKAVFQHVANLFRAHGSNIWFEWDVKALLPEGFAHADSPEGHFRKETDIMDVWFDSGSSHTGVIKERGGNLPVDLYLEGSDQYRGWFNSSLIISTAVHGHSPYRNVVSHGFVLDGKGEKMSKSMGNTVEPNKVVKQSGADILRLWASSIDYQSDVRISDELLKQVIENYKKMRNTFRFILGNIHDFTENDKVALKDLPEVDSYILDELNRIIKLSLNAYRNFDYKTMVSAISNFMTNEMSAYYLDFTKDILYIEKAKGLRRREVQTVLYTVIDALHRLLAPVLAHTMEEVHDYLVPGSTSVHTLTFPEVMEINAVDQAAWAQLFALRSEIFKALEEARAEKIIGKSLEAKLVISLKPELKTLVETYLPKFAQWLIVSQVEVLASEKTHIQVLVAEGITCPRCWNVTHSHAEDGLCERCAAVIAE